MKMRELPVRKKNRLKGYDYSNAGCYFVTICVKDRHEILWDAPVGAAIGRPLHAEPSAPPDPTAKPVLSEIGIVVDEGIQKIGHI